MAKTNITLASEQFAWIIAFFFSILFYFNLLPLSRLLSFLFRRRFNHCKIGCNHLPSVLVARKRPWVTVTVGFQSCSFLLRVKNISVRFCNFVSVQKRNEARSTFETGTIRHRILKLVFPSHDKSPFRVGDFFNGRTWRDLDYFTWIFLFYFLCRSAQSLPVLLYAHDVH